MYKQRRCVEIWPATEGRLMKSLRYVLFVVALAVICSGALIASAQDTTKRKELRRADLAGAPGMEVVLSITELKPGDEVVTHFHHGVETGYVLAGGMVKAAGKPAFTLKTGESLLNLRGDSHGGFTVVGDNTIELLTVHVVDKGKPLYDSAGQ